MNKGNFTEKQEINDTNMFGLRSNTKGKILIKLIIEYPIKNYKHIKGFTLDEMQLDADDLSALDQKFKALILSGKRTLLFDFLGFDKHNKLIQSEKLKIDIK